MYVYNYTVCILSYHHYVLILTDFFFFRLHNVKTSES